MYCLVDFLLVLGLVRSAVALLRQTQIDEIGLIALTSTEHCTEHWPAALLCSHSGRPCLRSHLVIRRKPADAMLEVRMQ